MKQFREIFGKVMIEVSSNDVAMMGADIPVVTMDGSTWAEFITWANKAFSPNLGLAYAYINKEDGIITAKVGSYFTAKSASALKANGFTDWFICADDTCDDDGRPLGCPGIYINIPYTHVQGI